MVFVSHVLPPLGPVAGGTNVSVYGTNFVPREIARGLACSFDGLVVNATFLSTSHLLCDSPPARMSNPGVVTVEMSLNRQEFYSGSTFAYAAEGQVVTPVPASKGRKAAASRSLSSTHHCLPRSWAAAPSFAASGRRHATAEEAERRLHASNLRQQCRLRM